MNILKYFIVCAIIIFVVSMGASAETFYCDTCAECNAKIQNATSVDTVMLTSDIVDCDGTCIDFNGRDGITFDGGGHIIDGTRGIQDYGIYLPAWSCTNTIMNCTITDFWDGIYIFNSPHNFVYNVTSYNNRDSGITILYSTGCTVGDCVLQENAGEDFYFRPYYRSDCQCAVTNVTGSGDRPIGFYTEPVDISDMEFSALYLCDAGAATFDNVSVIGSDTFDNNAIRMYYTSQAELSNITVHNNFMGLYMDECYDCVLRDSSFHDSWHYNIQMSYSDMNTIENVVSVGSSQAGIYLYHSAGNHIINATIGSNERGICLDDGFNTLIKDSHIVDNDAHGICVMSSGNHLVYNNYFSNSVNVDLAGVDVYESFWNTTNTTGTNIIGGPFIGGNYWSDHTGEDVNGDGFIDTPYTIEGSSINIDYLPLTEVDDPIHPTMFIRNGGYDLVVGDVFEYLVTCINESGSYVDCGEMSWNSSNVTVGTMDGANITCLAVGSTNITVTGFNLTDEITQVVIAAPSGINNVTMSSDDYYVPECGSTVVEVRMNSSDDVEEWMTVIEFDPNVVNITGINFSDTVSNMLGRWSHNGSYIVAWGMSSYMGPVSGDWRLFNITVEGNGTGVAELEFNESGGFLAEGEIPVFHNVTWEGYSMQYVGCGDVDCDGFVSANDVIETYRKAVNPEYPVVCVWCTDVDSDGFISANDVIEIYRRAVNPSYPLNCS